MVDSAGAPHTSVEVDVRSVSLSFLVSCSFCACRICSGLPTSIPTLCSVTTAFGVKPSAARASLRMANRICSESILVLRSQPGGTGRRIFGSWSVRVGTSVSGAATDWHFSALGLLPEQPAAVTVSASANPAAVTARASATRFEPTRLRIWFPSRESSARVRRPIDKQATAYRRPADSGRSCPLSTAVTKAQTEQPSTPSAQTAPM